MIKKIVFAALFMAMGANVNAASGQNIEVVIVSSKIRENDPSVMDVIYRVNSSAERVKVRALAFESNGGVYRSFAHVIRPETFIEGTSVNIGDAIVPNVEHTLSWRVSSDWTTKLAKVKFEVLALAGELMPLETMTIPVSDQYEKMEIVWNKLEGYSSSTCDQMFNALLWMYADKEPGLTLTNGQLKNGDVILAIGDRVDGTYRRFYCYDEGRFSVLYLLPSANVLQYILSKMGYSLLVGDALAYVNQETRMGIDPLWGPDDGSEHAWWIYTLYGYKIVP